MVSHDTDTRITMAADVSHTADGIISVIIASTPIGIGRWTQTTVSMIGPEGGATIELAHDLETMAISPLAEMAEAGLVTRAGDADHYPGCADVASIAPDMLAAAERALHSVARELADYLTAD